MPEPLIKVLIYLNNVYNCSMKFGPIEESEVVLFLILDYYLICKVMHTKFQCIFRKFPLRLISASPTCSEIAARDSSEGRISIKRYTHIHEKRWSQLEDLMLEYFESIMSREQTTLQIGSVYRFCTIGSNRGQHFSEKEVNAYRKFLEHSWIAKDCSNTTPMAFLKKRLLPIGYRLICDKNMSKRRAKSNDISGVNIPKHIFKFGKGLNFNDGIATPEDLFPNTSYTLKMLDMKTSKVLKSGATEGQEHGLIGYHQRRQRTRPWNIPPRKTKNMTLENTTIEEKKPGIGRYHQRSSQILEKLINAVTQFPENSLISRVLSLRSYVELKMKISYLQSIAFIIYFVYLYRSNNLQDFDKYNKRGPGTINTTAKGQERKTRSLNKWIQLFALSFVFTSFGFTRHNGCANLFEISVQRDRASYSCSKGFDFDEVALAPFQDFYEKVKDTIFSSLWNPYVRNDQCFVYNLHTQTTNATQDDASATESCQGQEETDVTVTEVNVSEESHPEPEASGPILESTSRRITLPFQLVEGTNQLESISLSRSTSLSTGDDRVREITAIESLDDHSANSVEEDETDFGFSLRRNPANATSNDRHRINPVAGIHATFHPEDPNIESEHSFSWLGLNLWTNVASARNNPSQRTGPSAGVLRAVIVGTENSQGGAFSTSQSVTGDTLNPVLNVSLNDAFTLREAGNADEMQTFTPNDVDVNPPLVRRRVNRRLGRVFRDPISASEIDEQSRGILDSMILLRQQGDVHERLNIEDAEIFLHPSDEEG